MALRAGLISKEKRKDMENDIHPSAEARHLFGQMVARSDDNLILPLASVLQLAVDRKLAGHAPQAEPEVDELMAEGWIEAHPDGGWALFEGVSLTR
jgi:hypothetical protein